MERAGQEGCVEEVTLLLSLERQARYQVGRKAHQVEGLGGAGRGWFQAGCGVWPEYWVHRTWEWGLELERWQGRNLKGPCSAV